MRYRHFARIHQTIDLAGQDDPAWDESMSAGFDDLHSAVLWAAEQAARGLGVLENARSQGVIEVMLLSFTFSTGTMIVPEEGG